jgi:MOSC domain-containing protein YiiM
VDGQLVSIWIKSFHRGPMKPVDSADLVAGRGLAGSADQGGTRQITIISESSWDDAQEELGIEVDPSARRANVMLRGVDLENSRGKLLRVGDSVIRISGEVRPCERMEQAQAGLRAVLKPRWRGGAFGEIIEGGTIHVGDAASWIPTSTG